MGFRFRKSITIFPGVKANISKSGVSLTVGGSGHSINIGKNGAFLNLGLPGTGVSYRKKLTSGIKKSSSASKSSSKTGSSVSKATSSVSKKGSETSLQPANDYVGAADALMNLHQEAGTILTRKDYDQYLSTANEENAATLRKIINGDEETINSLIDDFNASLDLDYEFAMSYELSDDTLYCDLDLPEIEDFEELYGEESGRKNVAQKTKREEYAKIVSSLSIFMAAKYFNLTPYIQKIVMSAYTQIRNKTGDLEDVYLLSVKFTRSEIEATDFSSLADTIGFINKFENRINLSTTYIFKPVTPYEKEEVVVKVSPLIKEAISALRSLGYSEEALNEVETKLASYSFATSSEYLKEALNLLS